MDTGKRPQKAVKEIQQVSKRSELKRFKGQSSEVVEELKRTGERAWPWDKKRIWEMERERKSKKTFMMMQTWQPEEKKEKNNKNKKQSSSSICCNRITRRIPSWSNSKRNTHRGYLFYLEGWEKKWNFCKMNHQSWWKSWMWVSLVSAKIQKRMYSWWNFFFGLQKNSLINITTQLMSDYIVILFE